MIAGAAIAGGKNIDATAMIRSAATDRRGRARWTATGAETSRAVGTGGVMIETALGAAGRGTTTEADVAARIATGATVAGTGTAIGAAALIEAPIETLIETGELREWRR